MSISKKGFLGLVLLMWSASLLATNWLFLQGTEEGRKETNLQVWGFIQAEYQRTDGTEVQAGAWVGQDASFNFIAPDLKSNDTLRIFRARIGARGWFNGADSKINYVILGEFAGNGLTNAHGDTAQLSDASITLNHLKGARIRVGQFKVPGFEEGQTAGFFNNYVNYTTVGHKLMLERYFDEDGTDTSHANKANHGVNGFRDIGIQVFDSFQRDSWEHSYAVMVGNGNGLSRSDNDDKRDLHFYWSSEKIMGKGMVNRPGLKLFAWMINGERKIHRASMGITDSYDRDRFGFGTTYYTPKMRIAAEYVKGEGMIFNGTDGGAVPGQIGTNGAVASFNVEPEEEADGYYVDFGYKLKPKFELDFRYDVYNRATVDPAKERTFETMTFGFQYFFTKKVIWIVNYELRDAEAPNLDGSAGANVILDGMDDQFASRLTLIF